MLFLVVGGGPLRWCDRMEFSRANLRRRDILFLVLSSEEIWGRSAL